MGSSVGYWWLEPILTLVGIISGSLIVIWQIARQHRYSLLLQKNNMKDQLRLEVYKEFAERMEKAVKDVSLSMARVDSLPNSLKFQQEIYSILQIQLKTTSERSTTLYELYNTANVSIISLIALMEKYEIAMPNFKQFITAFIDHNHVFREAFNTYYQEIRKFLPIDVPEDEVEKVGQKVLVPRQLDEGRLAKLESLAERYQKACVDFQAYFIDLRIALQNHLLGSLFDHRLPARKPNKPGKTVLKMDDE
jgi:hypothetical protein